MSIDRGFGSDGMGVLAEAPFADTGRERAMLFVQKWDLEQTTWAQRKLGLHPLQDVRPGMFAALKIRPYEELEIANNLITSAGWAQMLGGGIFGGGATLFSTTVGRIGIGSGTPTVAASDTALSSVAGMSGAGSNWKLSGANPTISTASSPATAVFTATFGTTDALGTWNEWAIDHGTANSTAGTPTASAVAAMINHAAPGGSGPGTKGAATWSATATLSFT